MECGAVHPVEGCLMKRFTWENGVLINEEDIPDAASPEPSPSKEQLLAKIQKLTDAISALPDDEGEKVP